MKKILQQITLIILTFTINSLSQWSTDPNNNLIVGYGQDPRICSDGTGGCYITYDYHNLYYPRWLALERLDKYGYKPWGINKRILGESPEQSGAKIIEDGEGGVIVSYSDSYQNLPYWTQRIRVQKVDSSGNFLWGPTGVRVTTTEINQGSQAIVSDGSGGCVVVWQNYDERILMNRIDRNGQRVWSDSGIVIASTGTSLILLRASDGNYYVQIRRNLYRIREDGEIIRRDSVTLGYPVADSDGGLILSGKTGTINNIKLISQRKDSLGNNLWQEPYVEIADSLDINTHLEIKYNNGFIYYSWSGKKNGIDKGVCKIIC
ncbi:MAG: hypothetical protein B6D44_13620, partial [Ignavibacteriales bacterium UTCHB2]